MFPDAEADRQWETMRDCTVLALKDVMINSEFKDQFMTAYHHYLSLDRQRIADKILKIPPKYGPPDVDLPNHAQDEIDDAQ